MSIPKIHLDLQPKIAIWPFHPRLWPQTRIYSINTLATVAEADAAVLAQQGSLYKDYTLPGKYAKYNLPGTPTGSQNSKRQNTDPNDWWLPNAGVSATGSLPFGNYSSIFHNVLYCGAYGDGIHDDTAAINNCLNTACGEGCGSTSTRGSVVYFPPGINSDLIFRSVTTNYAVKERILSALLLSWNITLKW